MRCYLFGSTASLAALVFVAFFSHGVLVAGDEPTKTVIDVGVYYESLCGDSMRWIRDQLVPVYDTIKDHVNITFIPYGKATHDRESETGRWRFTCQHGSAECRGNKAQACAIHAIKTEELPESVQQLTVSLIGCAMSARYPPTAVPQCAQQVGLSQQTQKSINECIEGPLSDDLLAANGDKTSALDPSLTFVPTITINGVNSKENQNAALNNFLKLICDRSPEASKPSQCPGSH